MTRRKAQPITQRVITLGGGLSVIAGPLPFCDCPRPGWGFVKREDGVWVRPCCRRVTETVWFERGEVPSPGLDDCPGCTTDNHRSDAPWRTGAAS